MQPSDRDFARGWFARAAVLVSLLAVLGTSKPEGWSASAVVSGPTGARAGRTLALQIESSAEPTIVAKGAPRSYAYPNVVPCLARWSRGTKLSCLLPPAATLDDVTIHGGCGGCDNACPPPKGSFVRVTSSEVAYSTDVVSSRMSAVLPSHTKDWVATRIEVLVDGSVLAKVKLVVEDSATGAPISNDEQLCGLEPSGAGTRAWCLFLVDDGLFKTKTRTTIVAEATAWDACPAGWSGAAPCPAPKTLKIASLGFAK